MPDLSDEREWTLTPENYVWRAQARPGCVPVVKNGHPLEVVPKSRALAAEERIRKLERDLNIEMAEHAALSADIEEAEERERRLRASLERIEERLNPGKTGNPSANTGTCHSIARDALTAVPEGPGEPSEALKALDCAEDLVRRFARLEDQQIAAEKLERHFRTVRAALREQEDQRGVSG